MPYIRQRTDSAQFARHTWAGDDRARAATLGAKLGIGADVLDGRKLQGHRRKAAGVVGRHLAQGAVVADGGAGAAPAGQGFEAHGQAPASVGDGLSAVAG